MYSWPMTRGAPHAPVPSGCHTDLQWLLFGTSNVFQSGSPLRAWLDNVGCVNIPTCNMWWHIDGTQSPLTWIGPPDGLLTGCALQEQMQARIHSREHVGVLPAGASVPDSCPSRIGSLCAQNSDNRGDILPLRPQASNALAPITR